MTRGCLIRSTLAVLLMSAATSARADVIQFTTGDVEKDFPINQPGIAVITNSKFPASANAAWLQSNGISPGLAIKDIRMSYDQPSDSLYVGVNFFGIAGMVGNNPPPNQLLGKEAIVVGFNSSPGITPSIVAGIPAQVGSAGPGLEGFNIAKYANKTGGIEDNFGAKLDSQFGYLAYKPSAEHPDFEFMIKNISTAPGIDLTKGLSVIAFAGSSGDYHEEQGFIPGRASPEVITPEPATVLAWSMIAGAAAYLRRRRRAA